MSPSPDAAGRRRRSHAASSLATVVLFTLVLGLVACGGADDEGQPLPPRGEVTGIVVDLDGTLTEVRRFTLRTDDGDTVEFVPAPGATFDGGPIAHLRDHLVSAEKVRVRYESDGGRFIAVAVKDA